jgi:hypothetical protein
LPCSAETNSSTPEYRKIRPGRDHIRPISIKKTKATLCVAGIATAIPAGILLHAPAFTELRIFEYLVSTFIGEIAKSRDYNGYYCVTL